MKHADAEVTFDFILLWMQGFDVSGPLKLC